MLRFAIALLAGTVLPVPMLLAEGDALFGNPVSDEELATMRGGFLLPNGIDIALVVRTETSIDGGLVLRSVFSAIEGAPSLQVFAPAPGQIVSSMKSQSAEGPQGGGAGSALAVQFDRQNGAVFVATGVTQPTITVVSGGGAAGGEVPLPELALAPDGGSVATGAGNVSLHSLPNGSRVRLEAEQLDISHLFGAAIGSAIANAGSNRAIDTETSVSIDLRNASPDMLGSTMFRVESVGIESARMLAR